MKDFKEFVNESKEPLSEAKSNNFEKLDELLSQMKDLWRKTQDELKKQGDKNDAGHNRSVMATNSTINDSFKQLQKDLRAAEDKFK